MKYKHNKLNNNKKTQLQVVHFVKKVIPQIYSFILLNLQTYDIS